MEEGGSEGGGRSYGRTVVRPPPSGVKAGLEQPPVQRGEFSRNPAPCDRREKERGGED